ncbi:hypothetical protein IAQ61_004968 [Plenodomus lingam]|uniref:uncharacterized protein n=1 Tax=Leptosphaeria maculans TaxID=5022 RepID=UPI003319A3D6|nr:hypothetical protein IAQ61_004968 [Plenodomus lingam]
MRKRQRRLAPYDDAGLMSVHEQPRDTTWWDALSDARAASPGYEHALDTVSYAELLAQVCSPTTTPLARTPSTTTPHHTTSSPCQSQSPSSTEAVVASLVAQWLQNHESSVSPLLQDLFRSKGYQLVPLKPSRPPASYSPSRRKKPSSMVAWWARFLRLTASDITLTPSQLALVSLPLEVLAGFDSLPLPTSPALDLASNPVESTFFTNSILFTITLSASSFRMSILCLTMRLFFFIASQPSFWAAHAQNQLFNANSRLERLNDDWYARLYHTLAQHLPVSMTEDLFRVELDTWRKAGRKYAYIAHHLGLGSLVHLRDYISPSQLWGCTTGGEKSCNATDAIHFLRNTLGVHQLAEKSGADALMHTLLWNLFTSLPSFGSRMGAGQPFPGFGPLHRDVVMGEERTVSGR